MSKTTLGRIVSATLLTAVAFLFLVNVSAMAASSEAEAEPAAYGLKYVANGVWHCTDSASSGCDTPSSHVWLELQ